MASESFFNFSGGVNAQASALVIRDEECEVAINVDLQRVGALSKRTGYEQYGDTQATRIINGLYEFEGKVLFLQANTGNTSSSIYYYDTSTNAFAVAKNDVFSIPRMRFVSFIDRVYATTAATQPLASTDGITWDGTNMSSAPVGVKYIEVFQARMYLANRSFSPNRVWFSTIPSSGSFSWDTGTNGQWFDVNPSEDDEITALENNGNRLLIFKNRSLYRWNFGQVEPDRLIGVGTSSQESVKTNFDAGITFFANSNGVYAYSGDRPRLLSRKIKKYIDAVSDWDDVVAEIDTENYYLYVDDITVDGRTIQNAMFVYNMPLDSWTIYSFPHFISRMHRGIVENEKVPVILFASEETGKVYRFNETYSDDGEAINMEFRSKEYFISYPEKALVNRVDVFAEKRGTAQVLIDVDRHGSPAPLGNLHDRVTSLRNTNPREANSVRLYINDSSTSPCVIEGVNLEFEGTPKRNENAKRTRNANIHG